MKKVILIVTALVMVLSGVAAVSAWEAHTVNVSAKCENAIQLKVYDGGESDVNLTGAADNRTLSFGTVFPEEWLTGAFDIEMSTSFCAQERINRINYALWVEEKDGHDWPSDGTNAFMFLKSDPATVPPLKADMTALPVDSPGSGNCTMIAGSETFIWKELRTTPPGGIPSPDPEHTIWVAIDGPVFTGFYNEATDAAAQALREPYTKPSGDTTPTAELPAVKDGTLYGFDLKIQVTGIELYLPEP